MLADEYFPYDLVVCTKNGNWVHSNNFRRAFKVTVEQLELPGIHLHDLRHTYAIFLMADKVNPKIIQERLGHKNVTVTLNTYTMFCHPCSLKRLAHLTNCLRAVTKVVIRKRVKPLNCVGKSVLNRHLFDNKAIVNLVI